MGGCLSELLFEEEANHQQHKIRQQQRKNELNRSLERQYKDSKRKKHNDTDKEIQQNINNHYYENQNNVKDDKDYVYEKQKQIELKHYHIQQYNLSNNNNNNNNNNSNINKIDTNELKSSKGNILSVLNSNTLSGSTLAPLSPAGIIIINHYSYFHSHQ